MKCEDIEGHILVVTTYLINELEEYRGSYNKFNEITKLINELHNLIEEKGG